MDTDTQKDPISPPSANDHDAGASAQHPLPPSGGPDRPAAVLDTGLTPRGPSVTTGPVRSTMLYLALPVLAEQILNTFVGVFDVFLAGRISAGATSAIGLAAYVDWLASMIVMLVGTGTTALVSRAAGRGEPDEANHFANQSMTLAALVGIGVLVLFFTLAPAFAHYCNMTGEVFDIAVGYLRIGAFGDMLLAVTIVGCAALRGVGDMRTPMAIFAVINGCNVVASLTLVYGFGPVPAFGVHGIVGGTVTARTIGAVLTVLLLLRGRSGLRLVARALPITWARTKRILHIGMPAAADGAVMWTGHFLFLRIIANLAEQPLGQAYFAAHIIAIRVEAFTYLPATAWAAATATMIGQALGAEDPRRARRSGHEGVLQCGLLSIVITALFFFGAEEIYRLMSTDALVRSQGIGPFRVLALFQPLLVMSIVYIGGLRGAGDTRFPLLITLTGILVFRLPLGYLFGIVLGGGLLGAWTGMFCDMIWRAIGASLRFVRGKWLSTRV